MQFKIIYLSSAAQKNLTTTTTNRNIKKNADLIIRERNVNTKKRYRIIMENPVFGLK
jgi:hypothetical protein